MGKRYGEPGSTERRGLDRQAAYEMEAQLCLVQTAFDSSRDKPLAVAEVQDVPGSHRTRWSR